MSSAATVEGDERLRLFLALELPAAVSASLRSWAERHVVRGRRLDHFHVTLAFLGARPASELDGIVSVLRASTAECGSITLEPVRYRETRSVGMLELADATGEAGRLAERLQSRLEELGVYRREQRAWLPHVTVVRFRERPKLSPPVPGIATFSPSGAAAFLSRLRRSGAQYEVLESCPLGSRPSGT